MRFSPAEALIGPVAEEDKPMNYRESTKLTPLTAEAGDKTHAEAMSSLPGHCTRFRARCLDKAQVIRCVARRRSRPADCLLRIDPFPSLQNCAQNILHPGRKLLNMAPSVGKTFTPSSSVAVLAGLHGILPASGLQSATRCKSCKAAKFSWAQDSAA